MLKTSVRAIFAYPKIVWCAKLPAKTRGGYINLADRLDMPRSSFAWMLDRNEFNDRVIETLDLLGFDVEVKLVPKPEVAALLDARDEEIRAKGLTRDVYEDPFRYHKPGDFSSDDREERIHGKKETVADRIEAYKNRQEQR